MMNINEQCIKLTECQVKNIVKELSIKLFNEEFTLPVERNGRLSTTLAYFQFYLKSHRPIRIACSNKIYNGGYKLETIVGILIHELCHWWLFMHNKPCGDKDIEFKQLVKSKGGPLTGEVKGNRTENQYYCTCCNQYVGSTKASKILEKRYKSTCCHASLRYKTVTLKDESHINLKINLMEYKSITSLFNQVELFEIPTIKEQIKKVAEKEQTTFIKGLMNNRQPLQENLKLIKGLNKIEDLVIPTKTGITNYSVYVAIRYSINNNSKEGLELIKKYYNELFERQINCLTKKQYNEYKKIMA